VLPVAVILDRDRRLGQPGRYAGEGDRITMPDRGHHPERRAVRRVDERVAAELDRALRGQAAARPKRRDSRVPDAAHDRDDKAAHDKEHAQAAGGAALRAALSPPVRRMHRRDRGSPPPVEPRRRVRDGPTSARRSHLIRCQGPAAATRVPRSWIPPTEPGSQGRRRDSQLVCEPPWRHHWRDDLAYRCHGPSTDRMSPSTRRAQPLSRLTAPDAARRALPTMISCLRSRVLNGLRAAMCERAWCSQPRCSSPRC
jgi:hypothetical protein